MAELNTIVERAKRLLRLQKRAATPGEAEAAAKALAKIIERYRIDAASLEEPLAAEAFIESDEAIVAGFVVAPWKEHLALTVCKHYSVFLSRAVRLVRRGSVRRNVKGLFMCGAADDVALARHMFAWLSAESTRLGREYSKCARCGRKPTQSWRLGFVHGIGEQLRQARSEAHQEAREQGCTNTALVVIKTRLDKASEFFERNHGKLPVRNLVDSHDGNIVQYTEGLRRGSQFHLGKSLPAEQGKS